MTCYNNPRRKQGRLGIAISELDFCENAYNIAKNKRDRQILHFAVSQKRWLHPCNARVGRLLHKARVVVPDSSFVPGTPIILVICRICIKMAGRPFVCAKQLWILMQVPVVLSML
jgi:hypothetical protein